MTSIFLSIFVDAGVDNEILLSFTRDDLKDLFHGADKFMLRRRIWNVIENAVCWATFLYIYLTFKNEKFLIPFEFS